MQDGLDDEERTPLWARGLGRDPDQPEDAVPTVVREPEVPTAAASPDAEPDPGTAEPPPPPALLPGSWTALAIAGAGAILAAAVLGSAGHAELRTVPSSWEQIPMTCDTLRIDEPESAVETFTCRAIRGRSLPPGVYTGLEARWQSDLTGEYATLSRLVIGTDGILRGVAVYA